MAGLLTRGVRIRPASVLGNVPDAAPAELDTVAASLLRRVNVIVGSAHALQAVVLLAIATSASLPASFLIRPRGAGTTALRPSAACGSTGSSRRSCCSPPSITSR